MLSQPAHLERPRPRFLDILERATGTVVAALAHLRRQRRRGRDLRHLSNLDDRLLADIGVRRHEVERLLHPSSRSDEAWPLGLHVRR